MEVQRHERAKVQVNDQSEIEKRDGPEWGVYGAAELWRPGGVKVQM